MDIKLLEKLSNAVCLGHITDARDIVKAELSDIAEIEEFGQVGLIAKINKGKDKTRLLDAHMDEVGLMVTDITSGGFLKFDEVGGIDRRVLVGKSVAVGRKNVPGVIGIKPVHLCKGDESKNIPEYSDMYIDIGADSLDEALGVVGYGDSVRYVSDFIETETTINAKAIDDRFGCLVLIELIKSELDFDMDFAFVVQEEVGLRGAKTAAYTLDPEFALVMETTTSAEIPEIDKSKQVCTLGDLFADIGCGVVYKDGELFFKSTSDLINSGSGHAKLGDTRTKEMADFSYRELCMTMDTVYGLPSMSRLTPSIREKGFDEALSSYNSVTPRIKELLHSESIKDYCKGMRLLNYYLFDGGHTQMDYGLERMMEKYGIPNAAGVAEELLDESEPERAKIRADVNEKLEMTEMKSSLVAEKTAAYEKLELVLSGDGTALYRSGDTYFFDFNSFKNAVVKPFKEALDYAKDHNAKNFVIDLSTNGGGGDYIVNYMLAVILGEDTHFNKSIASGSTVKTNILVDKNLDGKFDEKDDAVKYDFRFAVITSKYSYSNANCMPCAAQDGGVAILGESSGGGSCVISGHFTPDGILYSISGSSLDIHPNGEDVDAGTAPDTALSGAKEGYKGFYDIDAINKGIDAFYNK